MQTLRHTSWLLGITLLTLVMVAGFWTGSVGQMPVLMHPSPDANPSIGPIPARHREALPSVAGFGDNRQSIDAIHDLESSPSLCVLVRDPDGRPITAARVVASSGVSRLIGDSDLAPGETNESGEATIQLKGWAAHVVLVSKSGYASQRIVAAPGQLSVVLGFSTRVTVTTFDAQSGESVGHARVQFHLAESAEVWEFTSDGNGLLMVDTLKPGRYDLIVDAEGYLEYTMHAVQLGQERSLNRIEAPMYRGITLTGRVVDEVSGAPLTEGLVFASLGIEVLGRSKIDSNGGFSIGGLPTAQPFFEVLAAGYDPSRQDPDTPARYEARTGRNSGEILVRARRVAQAKGVVHCGGIPIRDATVMACRDFLVVKLGMCNGDSNGAAGVSTTATGADGTFCVNVARLRTARSPGVSNRPFELLVAKAGFAPKWIQVDGVESGSALEIDLERGSTLKVVVLNEHGDPESNAQVVVVSGTSRSKRVESSHLRKLVGVSPVTGQNGVAIVENLVEGKWEILVTSQDGRRHAKGSVEVVESGLNHVSLTLANTGVYWGRVVDRRNLAVAGARVVVPGAEPAHRTTTNGEGIFYLQIPGSESATLAVTGSRVIGEQEFQVMATEELVLEVEAASRPNCITGFVRDKATGQLISIVSSDISEAGVGRRIQNITGGRFRIMARHPADGEITFTAQGYRPWTSSLVSFFDLADESSVELERVDSVSEILSPVTIRLSQAMATLDVVAFDRSTGLEVGRANYLAPTEYEFLLKGSEQILVMAYSRLAFMAAPIACNPAASPVVEVTMTPGGGKVVGVRSTNRDDPVYLRGPHGLLVRQEVKNDEGFRSSQLAPGAYEVLVGDKNVATVQVEAGKTVTVAY